MKQIKYYTLGLLGTALLTAGLYACSNEEENNFTKDESGKTITTKSNDTFEGGGIANILNNTAIPLYNENDVKEALVENGVFTEVESIEITYGLNTELKKYEAFITVIGTETAGSPVVAVVGDLIIDGGTLVIPGESALTTFSRHSCTGKNCASCAFTRSGLFRRITGCSDCKKPIDTDQSSGCIHGINSGGNVVSEIAKELVKASTIL